MVLLLLALPLPHNGIQLIEGIHERMTLIVPILLLQRLQHRTVPRFPDVATMIDHTIRLLGGLQIVLLFPQHLAYFLIVEIPLPIVVPTHGDFYGQSVKPGKVLVEFVVLGEHCYLLLVFGLVVLTFKVLFVVVQQQGLSVSG